MTLTPTQRAVLEALAHMRVPDEDAWQTTRQLSRFVEGRSYDKTYRSLRRLWTLGLVDHAATVSGSVWWRITQAGRDALR